MINKESVGKTIAEYRKEKEYTQKEFARRLNVSCQAVSKWELGRSLPTVELMNDIAKLMGVTVDYLLNADNIEMRDICYKDTGLDTCNLYHLKDELDALVTKNHYIAYSNHASPLFYSVNTQGMKKPIFVTNTFVPGSKERLAKEYGKDAEICQELAAKAINGLLEYGITPMVFQAHLVCGNKSNEQIKTMAYALKSTCEAQGVDYGGLGISAQPINYLPAEYELSATISGVVDEKDVIVGSGIQEGDIIIALRREGIEPTSIPFLRVMLERNRSMAMCKVDNEHYFIDEVMKPARAYRWEIEKLQQTESLHGIISVHNTFMSSWVYNHIPEGLGAVLNMDAVTVDPIYKFLHRMDMVGEYYFPRRFSMGVSMLLIVPKEKKKEALKIIEGNGYVVGQIRPMDERIRIEGRLQWE